MYDAVEPLLSLPPVRRRSCHERFHRARRAPSHASSPTDPAAISAGRGELFIRFKSRPESAQPKPDGGTVNFLPDSDELVQARPPFSGAAPKMKQLATYSVRFEGVDALETRFQNQHQNLRLATAARDRVLELLGFAAASAGYNPVRGYLLANGIESNGRVLGLVYAGHGRTIST